MVKNGDLISLKRGIYVFSEKYRTSPLNYISIANILHKPSYVSFEYALSYHGLIPERVYTITTAAPKANIANSSKR
jgi:predicted transcriptional regulator of viral defense system